MLLCFLGRFAALDKRSCYLHIIELDSQQYSVFLDTKLHNGSVFLDTELHNGSVFSDTELHNNSVYSSWILAFTAAVY